MAAEPTIPFPNENFLSTYEAYIEHGDPTSPMPRSCHKASKTWTHATRLSQLCCSVLWHSKEFTLLCRSPNRCKKSSRFAMCMCQLPMCPMVFLCFFYVFLFFFLFVVFLSPEMVCFNPVVQLHLSDLS